MQKEHYSDRVRARYMQYAAFEETKHPRDEGGQFASVGGAPKSGGKRNKLADRPGYSQKPKDIESRQGLVDRLSTYEDAFEKHFDENPDATEGQAHRSAMQAAELTSDGLTTARSYAGKKASSKPGVFRLISAYE